jgi:hypothetical protein
MIKANGSRLDKTSFGKPLVVIVAACDVRLLFNWLYVSPKPKNKAMSVKKSLFA